MAAPPTSSPMMLRTANGHAKAGLSGRLPPPPSYKTERPSSPTVAERTCVVGRGCTAPKLRGFGVQSGDLVLIADTCGASDAGVAGLVAEPAAQGDIYITWPTLTAPGATYRPLPQPV